MRQELSRYLRLTDALKARVAVQQAKLAESQRQVSDTNHRVQAWQQDLGEQHTLRDRAHADSVKWKEQRSMLASKLKRAETAKREMLAKRQQVQLELEAAALASNHQVCSLSKRASL